MPTEQEHEHSDDYNAGYEAGKKEGWRAAQEAVAEALGIERVSPVSDDGEGEERPALKPLTWDEAIALNT